MKVSINLITFRNTRTHTVTIALALFLTLFGNLVILLRLGKSKTKTTPLTTAALVKPLPFGKGRGLIHVTRALQLNKAVKKNGNVDGDKANEHAHAQTGNILKKNIGYLSNETLTTSFNSEFLKPGSLEEAVTVRLMSVRRLPVVNPHNYDYVINPSHVCAKDRIKVVVVIVTSLKDFAIRQQFRYSIKSGYAGIWNDLNSTILLFFVGSLPPGNVASKEFHTKFLNESQEYEDIVQATYMDTYKNLSLKSVSILKWVSTYCSNAQFVIKADSDCDINIPLMMTDLTKMQQQLPLFMLGKVSRKRKPFRDPKSKWYIPLSVYSEEKFPVFMFGGSQGYPIAVAKLLYEASLRIPTFWLEDVYISGLCASLVNVPRFNSVAFYFSHFPPPGETEY